jgi:hypothetical protein
MKKITRIVFIAVAIVLAFFGYKKVKVNKG